MEEKYTWIVVILGYETWTSLIGKFVHPVGERGKGKVMDKWMIILAMYKINFLRVHNNLVLGQT